VKIGETAVEGPMELGEALPSAGGDTKIVFQREGKEIAVKVALPERP